MRSTSGLGFDYSSSEDSEDVEPGVGSYFHGMYRRRKSLRDRDDERVQKELGEAARRSLEETGAGGWWRNVAVENDTEGTR